MFSNVFGHCVIKYIYKVKIQFEDEAAMMDLNDVDFDEDLGIKKEETNEKLVKPKKEISM